MCEKKATFHAVAVTRLFFINTVNNAVASTRGILLTSIGFPAPSLFKSGKEVKSVTCIYLTVLRTVALPI